MVAEAIEGASGDRRAEPFVTSLLIDLGSGARDGLRARRSRRLLVGFGLPSVSPEETTYGRDDARKRWPDMPRPASLGDGAGIRDHVVGLLTGSDGRDGVTAALGISVDPPSNLPPITVMLTDEIAELEKQRGCSDPRDQLIPHGTSDQNAHEYERRVAELRARHRAEVAMRSRAFEAHYDQLRLRVLDVILGALSRLEHERGSLKWLYVREVYATILDNPECPTVLDIGGGHRGAHAKLALDRARSLGATIEVQS
jgi:hypothetical protein